MKPLKIQKFAFKNVPLLEHRVQNVPQISSETSLPRLVQNKLSALIRCAENKVECLERQFHSEKLSFVHKKVVSLAAVFGCHATLPQKNGYFWESVAWHPKKRLRGRLAKRKLSILFNFLFPFVSFIRVFSILKCKTLDHPMMNVRQPFCWWMSVTKVSNPLLPPPLMWLTIWLL